MKSLHAGDMQPWSLYWISYEIYCSICCCEPNPNPEEGGQPAGANLSAHMCGKSRMMLDYFAWSMSVWTCTSQCKGMGMYPGIVGIQCCVRWAMVDIGSFRRLDGWDGQWDFRVVPLTRAAQWFGKCGTYYMCGQGLEIISVLVFVKVAAVWPNCSERCQQYCPGAIWLVCIMAIDSPGL